MTAHRGNGFIFLSWQPPSSDGGSPVTNYQVFMGTKAGGEAAKPISSPTGTGLLVQGDVAHLDNGTTYFFTVEAVNAVGTGPASTEVSATPEPVPSAPTLTATPIAAGGGLKLTWTVPGQGGSPITHYELYQGTAAGAESATPTSVPARATGEILGKLTAGLTYYFYLEAVNSSGAGLPSNEASAAVSPVVQLPTVPLGLVAHRGNAFVFLAWQPPDDNGGAPITKYDVFMGTSPGGETATPISSGSGTTLLVHNDPVKVNNGTTYYFTVKAFNLAGAGPVSSEVSATPEPVPSAPGTLSASPGAANGSVKLSWSAPSSDGGSAITGFDVYQGTSPGGEGTAATAVAAGSTSYTVTGLTSAVTHYFYVAAQNSAGVGLASNEASAVPTGAPATPSMLHASGGNEAVELSWLAPGNNGGSAITGYTVSWRQGATGTISTVDLDGGARDHTVSGLSNGTTYEFSVAATNAAGTGPATTWADAEPTVNSPPLPPVITSATVVATGRADYGTVRISWATPSSAGCTQHACQVSGYTLEWTVYEVTKSEGGKTEGKLVTDGIGLPGSAGGYDVQDLGLDFSTVPFSLTAYNTYGPGPAAKVRVALELAPKAPVPTAVPGDKQVQISWLYNDNADANEGIGPISGYTVWQGTSEGKESSTPVPSSRISASTDAGPDNTTDVTLTVSGLDNGRTYYFKVAQSDAAGPSPQSTDVSATPTS